ncbi:hypothetical protein PR048_033297 [Dryococelus australis]|uniref:Uncharacterized protein n=1 Tax=Dryococelus australis TaxID=614101 RepID=A0ABQ9FZW5_9NEOP|nr:hypothetical protein PR048_033297 [Dryococelus australis]
MGVVLAVPLKGITSRMPGGRFKSSPPDNSGSLPPLSRTPADRKNNAITLLDVTDQPLGYVQAKKRKHMQGGSRFRCLALLHKLTVSRLKHVARDGELNRGEKGLKVILSGGENIFKGVEEFGDPNRHRRQAVPKNVVTGDAENLRTALYTMWHIECALLSHVAVDVRLGKLCGGQENIDGAGDQTMALIQGSAELAGAFAVVAPLRQTSEAMTSEAVLTSAMTIPSYVTRVVASAVQVHRCQSDTVFTTGLKAVAPSSLHKAGLASCDFSPQCFQSISPRQVLHTTSLPFYPEQPTLPLLPSARNVHLTLGSISELVAVVANQSRLEQLRNLGSKTLTKISLKNIGNEVTLEKVCITSKTVKLPKERNSEANLSSSAEKTNAKPRGPAEMPELAGHKVCMFTYSLRKTLSPLLYSQRQDSNHHLQPAACRTPPAQLTSADRPGTTLHIWRWSCIKIVVVFQSPVTLPVSQPKQVIKIRPLPPVTQHRPQPVVAAGTTNARGLSLTVRASVLLCPDLVDHITGRGGWIPDISGSISGNGNAWNTGWCAFHTDVWWKRYVAHPVGAVGIAPNRSEVALSRSACLSFAGGAKLLGSMSSVSPAIPHYSGQIRDVEPCGPPLLLLDVIFSQGHAATPKPIPPPAPRLSSSPGVVTRATEDSRFAGGPSTKELQRLLQGRCVMSFCRKVGVGDENPLISTLLRGSLVALGRSPKWMTAWPYVGNAVNPGGQLMSVAGHAAHSTSHDGESWGTFPKMLNVRAASIVKGTDRSIGFRGRGLPQVTGPRRVGSFMDGPNHNLPSPALLRNFEPYLRNVDVIPVSDYTTPTMKERSIVTSDTGGREQILEVQDMFRIANKVTRPEKALILGFMAGARVSIFITCAWCPEDPVTLENPTHLFSNPTRTGPSEITQWIAELIRLSSTPQSIVAYKVPGVLCPVPEPQHRIPKPQPTLSIVAPSLPVVHRPGLQKQVVAPKHPIVLTTADLVPCRLPTRPVLYNGKVPRPQRPHRSARSSSWPKADGPSPGVVSISSHTPLAPRVVVLFSSFSGVRRGARLTKLHWVVRTDRPCPHCTRNPQDLGSPNMNKKHPVAPKTDEMFNFAITKANLAPTEFCHCSWTVCPKIGDSSHPMHLLLPRYASALQCIVPQTQAIRQNRAIGNTWKNCSCLNSQADPTKTPSPSQKNVSDNSELLRSGETMDWKQLSTCLAQCFSVEEVLAHLTTEFYGLTQRPGEGRRGGNICQMQSSGVSVHLSGWRRRRLKLAYTDRINPPWPRWLSSGDEVDNGLFRLRVGHCLGRDSNPNCPSGSHYYCAEVGKYFCPWVSNLKYPARVVNRGCVRAVLGGAKSAVTPVDLLFTRATQRLDAMESREGWSVGGPASCRLEVVVRALPRDAEAKEVEPWVGCRGEERRFSGGQGGSVAFQHRGWFICCGSAAQFLTSPDIFMHPGLRQAGRGVRRSQGYCYLEGWANEFDFAPCLARSDMAKSAIECTSHLGSAEGWHASTSHHPPTPASTPLHALPTANHASFFIMGKFQQPGRTRHERPYRSARFSSWPIADGQRLQCKNFAQYTQCRHTATDRNCVLIGYRSSQHITAVVYGDSYIPMVMSGAWSITGDVWVADNPCSDLGNVVTIKLSENQENVLQADDTYLTLLVETHFQMNYNTGEWKRIKKYRKLDDSNAPLPSIASLATAATATAT